MQTGWIIDGGKTRPGPIQKKGNISSKLISASSQSQEIRSQPPLSPKKYFISTKTFEQAFNVFSFKFSEFVVPCHAMAWCWWPLCHLTYNYKERRFKSSTDFHFLQQLKSSSKHSLFQPFMWSSNFLVVSQTCPSLDHILKTLILH